VQTGINHVTSTPSAAALRMTPSPESSTASPLNTAAAPLLEARGLCRRDAAGRLLLDDVSLTLSAGQRVCISGPSGAGKTLLLRSLALLDAVDSGQVLWQGRPVPADHVPRFRRHVMYLHQRAALLADNVLAALQRPFTLRARRDQAFDRPQAEELLARLGRDAGFLDQRAENLSGGEIQIVALVRAILLQPAVLLLDEPTAAMDPSTAAAAEELLAAWASPAAQPAAYLWVTHDADQGGRVSTHRLQMSAGRLEA
jgi:putative ABC transport system ATP-binding protein